MAELNRRTLDTVYVNLYGDELYHHGVLGMSWGDRNGPPYPLGGVDKKVARAEYKAKKEKERRLKKMQKAAKKARKMKAKEAKNQAEILKKKQKLVKEGDLDKIRKNAELFTNEELQYVIDRDAQKRALGSKDERSADEKLELFMKRFGQIATIASSAKTVLEAGKAGAEMFNSFKAGKVKDLEAEDKRMNTIKTEFEMRFKGREDSPEAQRFINYAVNNEQYKPPKAEKKVQKEADKKRVDDLKEAERETRKNKKDKGESNDESRNVPKQEPQQPSRAEQLKSQGLLASRDKWRSKPVSSLSSTETSSGERFVKDIFSDDSTSTVKLSELGDSQTYRMGRSAMSSISTDVLPRSAQLSPLTSRTSFNSAMPSISSPLSKSDYATVRNMGPSMGSAPLTVGNDTIIGMQNRSGSSTGSMGEITSRDVRKLKKQNKKRWTFG